MVLLLPVRDQTCTLPRVYTIYGPAVRYRLSFANLARDRGEVEPLRSSSWRVHRGTTSQINFASNVIAVLRAFDTGQFFSAALAASINFVSSRFGTFARRVRAERLMRKP